MLELELSRKLGISLDEVYQLSSEFHRLFDSFEEILEEQKQEYESEIQYLREQLEE